MLLCYNSDESYEFIYFDLSYEVNFSIPKCLSVLPPQALILMTLSNSAVELNLKSVQFISPCMQLL